MLGIPRSLPLAPFSRAAQAAMFDDPRKLVAFAGFAVLFHACYAVISYRDELKISGDDFQSVPVSVMVECAIGALACAWGALGFAGEFLHIKAQPRELPPVSMEKMNDFIIFNHRGRSVPPPKVPGPR